MQQKDLTQPKQKSTAIKVFIRVRPLIGQQIGSSQVVQVAQDAKTVNITTDAVNSLTIKFDQALHKSSTQLQFFHLFQQSIHKIPQGYNMTVFAYGQTGSGKTHTMFGSDWQHNIAKNINVQKSKIKQNHYKQSIQSQPIKQQNTFFEDLQHDQNYAGLIPRTIYKLFQQINKVNQQNNNQPLFNIYCSFLQIYNQKIYDLLQDLPKPKALVIHESKLDGVFVQGLAEYAITHYVDCLQLMKRGQKNRFIRQTSMNTKSSRSHTIFQILLQSLHPDSKGMFKKARLNLCDLAGSQKIKKMDTMNDQHLQQLKSINQSLTTLGKVIASLSSKNKSLVASFRQSKLTRLLQQSLTGNTYTYIIGNISPSNTNMDQTMNTMKFVQRARHITMKVKPMQFNGQNIQIIHKLQKQINYLKQLLNLKRKGLSGQDIQSRLVNLQQQNQKLKRTTVSFQDVGKLIQENHRMKQQLHKLYLIIPTTQGTADIQSKSQTSFYSQIKSEQSPVADRLQQKLKKNGFQLQSHSTSVHNVSSNRTHQQTPKHFQNNKVYHKAHQKSQPSQNFDKTQHSPLIKQHHMSVMLQNQIHQDKNYHFPQIGPKDRYRSKSPSTQSKQQQSSLHFPGIQHKDRQRSQSHGDDPKGPYTPNQTKKSVFGNLDNGKKLTQTHQFVSFTPTLQKGSDTKKKQKQKILDKLQELQKIQRFNEQKLMRDLQKLDKKNQQTELKNIPDMSKKKSIMAPISTQRRDTKVSLSQHKNINYEQKIKQLEAKLFGNK